jgi:predicted small secreted protein
MPMKNGLLTRVIILFLLCSLVLSACAVTLQSAASGCEVRPDDVK